MWLPRTSKKHFVAEKHISLKNALCVKWETIECNIYVFSRCCEGVDVKKLKPCRVFITSVIIYGQTL